MEIVVGTPGAQSVNRAVVQSIELDTAFYTRNNGINEDACTHSLVCKVYEIQLLDELENKTITVAKDVLLKGDHSITIPVNNLTVTRVVATMAEGGKFDTLCRPHL